MNLLADEQQAIDTLRDALTKYASTTRVDSLKRTLDNYERELLEVEKRKSARTQSDAPAVTVRVE